MPKKKKSRGHPARHLDAASQLSPLRAGGRVLGDLQVPFRRFLEEELSEDETVLEAADLEARVMESLGWLVLTFGYEPVPATGRRFTPDDLAELFTEIVPAVAEHNELDPQELVDETRLAWTSYLMFLGESDQWAGDPGELADCLDVASGGVGGTVSGQGSVLDALAAAEAAQPVAGRLADLLDLPVVTAALAAVDELAVGVELGGAGLADGPAVEVLRSRLEPFGAEIDPVTLLLDLTSSGFVVVDDDRTTVPDAGDPERRYQLATTFLAALVSGTLAACPSPGAIVGALSVVASAVLDPITTGRLRELLAETGDEEELPAALAVVTRLVDVGVLSAVEPWTARPGFAGAVHDVVEGFFGSEQD
ncbi:hypothetical protein [Kineococcus sp. SYSU DK003]|uniref:hypothetical protein n=1 Tax=Kineococcus sp. SYSU DK003 TaxID=3383124 RepID=UPI003D7EF441